jgi:hypothetical protein
MSGERRDDRVRLWVAIALSFLVVTSGVFAYESLRTPSPSRSPSGLDFSTVDQLTSQALNNSSGRPWILASALGVVSSQPSWLDPLGEQACLSYEGVSVWNASRIPLASGQFSTGVAPFWSLIYENASGSLVDAVSLDQSIHYVGPIPASSACGAEMATFLGGITASPVQTSEEASAQTWGIIGSSYVRAHPGAIEFYEIGAGQLFDWGSAPTRWIDGYEVCGLAGYAGTMPETSLAVKFLTPTTWEVINQTGGCGTVEGYDVQFGAPSPTEALGPSVVITLPMTVNFSGPGNTANAFGLISWFLGVSLSNVTTGQPLAPGKLVCSNNSFSLSTCHASGGWFAGLLSPTSYWLDVFGSVNGTDGWVLSDVPAYTADSLALVFGTNPGNSSLTLSVHSTTDETNVTGQATV